VPIGVVMLLLTSGCAEPAPEPAASDSAAAGEAFFASEEAAVEAALAVYAEYNAMADRIMADGGAEPERLAPYVNEALLESQTAGFQRMQEQGAVGTGSTRYWLREYQHPPSFEEPGILLAAYFCRDVTDVDVLGPDGITLVDPSRPDVFPIEVVWEISSDGTVKVAKDEPWVADDFCI
jgi:hypothetical protein